MLCSFSFNEIIVNFIHDIINRRNNMRFVFVLFVSLIIFYGCTPNSVAPINDQSLSVSHVQNNTLYTLSVSKYIFSIHDTLTAKLTVYNQSTVMDTLYSSFSPFFYNWTLKNNAGKIIMFGPNGANNSIRNLYLNPNQESILYDLYQAIKDTSGSPLLPGSYTLQWNLNNIYVTYLSFTLNIKIL